MKGHQTGQQNKKWDRTAGQDVGQHTNRIGQEMGHDSRTSTETGQEMGQDSGTRYGTAHQTGQDKKCDMTEQKQDAGHEMGQDSWAGQKVGQKQDSNFFL